VSLNPNLAINLSASPRLILKPENMHIKKSHGIGKPYRKIKDCPTSTTGTETFLPLKNLNSKRADGNFDEYFSF
jgi:hypothetical protein